MEVFDKDGNPVEGVFTQAEVDAKIAEAKALAVAAAGAVPPVVTPPTPATPVTPPAPVVDPLIASLQEQVAALTTGFQTSITSKFSGGLDADKKTAFETKFNELGVLSSYDKTPQGMERRAADAYALTTGQPFNFDALNMGNLGATGGKAPTVPNTELKEEDKALAEVLGNKPEDYKKYGSV